MSPAPHLPSPNEAEQPLEAASPADLLDAINYAMRFNERGKPLGVRMRDDPAVMARRVADHLERCGFVVMRRPAIQAHRTG